MGGNANPCSFRHLFFLLTFLVVGFIIGQEKLIIKSAVALTVRPKIQVLNRDEFFNMLVLTPLENSVRKQIKSLVGFAFQDLVVAVLYEKYRAEGFSSLRPTRDGGCDGIITAEKCAVACYGPMDAKMPAFRNKISDDYQLYRAVLEGRYPKWRFYVNFDVSEDHISLAASLHGDGDVLWGLGRLCQLINELGLGSRIAIYRLLKIPDCEFAQDVVRQLLEDLMAQRDEDVSVVYAAEAPDMEAKVRLNFDDSEVQSMLNLIDISLDAQFEVDSTIRPLSGTDVNMLKTRVIIDFHNMQGNNFAGKFKALQMYYAGRYNFGSDDVLQLYIVAFLIHVFSQCHIGLVPKKKEP